MADIYAETSRGQGRGEEPNLLTAALVTLAADAAALLAAALLHALLALGESSATRIRPCWWQWIAFH